MIKTDLLIRLYVTFFFLGNSPLAPGTAGTLGAILLFFFLTFVSFPIYIVFLLILTALSIFMASLAVKIYNSKDPGQIVIDEVCGYLFTMVLIPFSWGYVITGFLLFRILDILKPYPIRNIEKLRDGYGIVLDDVLAGVYANILMQIIIRVY
ncbi:MAG: phosphatidylglycerophosphatase A [Deltaproteobacteria bacterium]|nr:MAG: phosphatidylglycerophosphatase A [Deltaproteobacteria bacterium]TDJ06060.1 MAG: phosphatidylglycerophosphatase A [Deltaproteobacteria bacterium]